MTESETEAEILERLEAALRRIAVATSGPKHSGDAALPDRAALVVSLDQLISRLRAGLGNVPPAPRIPE